MKSIRKCDSIMTYLEEAKSICSLWATLIAEELVRLGVKVVCIAPGSRSTPLVAAIARRPELEKVVCQDERSAAFFALGVGRSTRRPAVLITTSGSAVANLLPAVVEASSDRVPLLLFTADRPPELRGIGANQAIDQPKIFGTYVRLFIDFPVPDQKIPLPFVLSSIDEALHKCVHPLSGPVHINFMFREPFVPSTVDPWDENLLSTLHHWVSTLAPLTQHFATKPLAETTAIQKVVDLMERSESGIIVAGAIDDEMAQTALLSLAEKCGWPILPDVLSNLRFCKSAAVVNFADLALLDDKLPALRSDVVIQVGGRIVSKRLQHYLDHNNANAHFFIDDHSDRLDPGCIVTHRIETQLTPFLHALADRLTPKLMSSHAKTWIANSDAVKNVVDAKGVVLIDEIHVARSLVSKLGKDHIIFASSSMPIRDLNMFANSQAHVPRLMANRGASGIDGIVSTACGVAKATKKRVVLLCGDLTFLHDTNGLSILPKIETPMVIVVINNHGGGIFTMLDIQREREIFTPYFDAEHDVELGALCGAHKIRHLLVSDVNCWNDALNEIPVTNEHLVVEVESDKWRNREEHERLRTVVSECFSM